MAVVAEDAVKEITYKDGNKEVWSGPEDGPRARKVKKAYTYTGGKLVQKFYFRDGDMLSFEFDPATKMVDEGLEGVTLGVLAANHGLTQKLGDEIATAKGDYDDMKEWLTSLAERLQQGRWGGDRVGGVGGTGILFRALVILKQDTVPGISEDDAKASVRVFMKGLSDEQKNALKSKGPAPLMAIIKRLEEEKAVSTPAIDTSKLLEGL